MFEEGMATFAHLPILRRIFTIFAFILYLNLFLFHTLGPVSFALLTLGFFLFILGVFIDRRRIKDQLSVAIGFFIIQCLFSTIIVFRSNPSAVFLSQLGSVFSLLYLTYLFLNKISFFRSLIEAVIAPMDLCLSYIREGWETAEGFLSGSLLDNETLRKSKLLNWVLVKQLITGLIIGVPIVIILLNLFSRADPIFANFINKIITLQLVRDLITRLIYSLVAFLFLSPFILFKKEKQFFPPIVRLEKYNWVQEMTVVMVLVAMTLAGFLIVQWPYVFASVPFETDLSKFGVATYSEYVRQGFTELLIIATIIYGLIWAGVINLRSKRLAQKTVLLQVQIVVLILFAIFIISIFRRIWLYQIYHGWTLVRIYGGFFLIFIGGITITLFLRHFWQKQWVKLEVLFTAGLITILGFFNAETFIVVNHPPTVNKRIDYIYLAGMSPDGYIGWKKAFDYAQKVLQASDLKDKALLDKEDRREIAYAGIIIHQLLRNYHFLINQFGIDRELTNYYKNVLEHEEKIDTVYITRLIGLEKSETPQSLKSDIVPQIPMEEQSNLLADAQTKQNKIADLLRKIDSNVINLEEAASIVFLPLVPTTMEFNDRLIYAQSFYQIDTASGQSTPFYLRRERQNIYLKDRLFVWNWSKVTALQSMMEELDLRKLLILSDAYFQLSEKIGNQTENERSYETDISFDTPFLEPL